MTVEFRGIEVSGLRGDPRLRAHIDKRVGATLEPVKLKPMSAQVAFFDDNGPKGGPAIRCALTVRLPYRPALRAEHAAETPRLAFDGGLAALERQLERYRERDRESRRYPKKYYAAGRLAEGALPPAPKRSRLRRAKEG